MSMIFGMAKEMELRRFINERNNIQRKIRNLQNTSAWVLYGIGTSTLNKLYREKMQCELAIRRIRVNKGVRI